jgi:hypothetical protein
VIGYHTTEDPEQLLADGFSGGIEDVLIGGILLTGVWLADTPLDGNEGARGHEVLRVEFPDTVDLGRYEIVEEDGDMGYREWYVPAALIDTHARVTWLSEDEVAEVKARRWQSCWEQDTSEVVRTDGGDGDAP